jgi:hypothetical protein
MGLISRTTLLVLIYAIRSTPHTTTINSQGNRVVIDMHITVDVGNSGLAAHIPCYGFDVTATNYYTNMTFGDPKWSDRATSSNASPAGSDDGIGDSAAGAQWVQTGSNIPGQQYRWWDGEQYTNDFC